MAFLDNSGDIILDAVLTDAGRKRLAAGNGSFKIVKFALGDDEINYRLYDKTNSSGSAYYDLNILTTPIEVAHTDSTISLKHKLFTLATPTGDPELLYMPELKLNTTSFTKSGLVSSRNAYVVIGEDDAFNQITNNNAAGSVLPNGYVDGRGVSQAVGSLGFRVAQGMATSAAGGKEDTLQDLLTETEFSIVMDRRYLEMVVPAAAAPRGAGGGLLGAVALAGGAGATLATPTVKSNVFSGATNLRVYSISQATHPTLFVPRPSSPAFVGPSALNDLMIYVKASSLLQTNEDYYYDNFGTDVNNFESGLAAARQFTASVIETTVRVIGMTMGLSVDIPVQVIAKR